MAETVGEPDRGERRARPRRTHRACPPNSSGIATFSSAVIVGIR